MQSVRTLVKFDWLDQVEGRLCLPCNHFCQIRPVGLYFKTVSRLGDGILWYALLIALPVLYGRQAFGPVGHMLATVLLGMLVYKLLKNTLLRERPFASHADLELLARPLDRYSFPSGHTLQAVLILTMLGHYFPAIALAMIPFGLSVAASRVVLGLHYPSDVMVGGLIGWGLASTSLALFTI